VGFEPMISTFEWAKTVHALDHMATVIGSNIITLIKSRRLRLAGNVACIGRVIIKI
jgi:hypothetical protein